MKTPRHRPWFKTKTPQSAGNSIRNTANGKVSTVQLLLVLQNLAHGVGQIFFQPHVVTGLLIVAGWAVASVPMAILGVLGAIISTLAARLVGLDTGQGLQGYNGALVGAAAWVSIGALWPATLATVLGAAACPAIVQAMAALLKPIKLPVLTGPFCVTSGLIALMVGQIMPVTGGDAVVSSVDGTAPVLFLEAVLTGVGQVVFVDSWLGGLLILIGLFVAGWRVGLSAFVGSAIGTVMTVAATNLQDALDGLGGYSPSLTAIAMAAVFLPRGAWAWIWAASGAALTVLVDWGFDLLPIPTYTWPFVVTTWILLTVTGPWRARAT